MKRSRLQVSPEEMLMRYPHLRQREVSIPKQEVLEIPFHLAVSLLRPHVMHRALKAGKSITEIYALLEDPKQRDAMTAELLGELGTIDAVVQHSPI
ncbi:hypothetical protein D3C72_1067120 [compost metagenome]